MTRCVACVKNGSFRHCNQERRGKAMQTNSPQANTAEPSSESAVPKDNHFRTDAVPTGTGLLVGNVAVFRVAASFCATQAKCPHKQGPLSEGKLDGSTVTCPWHGAQFN